MASPSVSVIIPAYNAAKTIRACLLSVLNAEYDGPCEVIVVDDGSTDDTCNIVESLDCRLIRKERNAGPALARNAGAEVATGEILVFFDADTEIRPDAIREAVRTLEEDGVDAVTGMYEPEPLNEGFFTAYYSYLKYHAFTATPTQHIYTLGAQCGAIRRALFERVGGYRPFRWGVDIENEELGDRITRHSPIALSRTFRVRHHFPEFRKLLYVFTGRIFWHVLLHHRCQRRETVLITRNVGLATAAFPAAMLALILALVVPAEPLNLLFAAGAITGMVAFVWGYVGFWALCARRRGAFFAGGAALASALFSVVITASATWAFLNLGWYLLRGRDTPLVRASLGQA